MSHSAKPTTNPQVAPELSPDKDSLISEFKKLDSMLAAINTNIQVQNDIIAEANESATAAQQNISALRGQGLQIVGQANIVTRILRSMGVDTEDFAIAPPGVAEEQENAPGASNLSPSEELGETPAPKRGLKNRFSPR